MKKLLTVFSLAIATISFAKTVEVDNNLEKESIKTVLRVPDYQYSISFPLPCGGHTITAYFNSPYTGIAFAAHLAYVIERAVEQGCAKVSENFEDIGV